MMSEHIEYYEVWKKRLEEKEKYIEQMREIRHDMQAHLIVLQYYLEAGMYEDAKTYLKQIRDAQMGERIEVEINTGNCLVNALIEEYLGRDKEIKFLCDGELTKNIKMSDYELCILFSNLMSNAVEACERVSNLPKEINMRMCVKEGQFVIRVENYIEWDIDFQLLGSGTTKENSKNHGYGIKNMKRVVEQKNGNVNFEIAEHKFCVSIRIPIVENVVKE